MGNGDLFVSTFEHESAPVYAVQWHPESAQFNEHHWIEHAPEDVEVGAMIARFIVSEARKNGHRPNYARGLPRVEDLPRKLGQLGECLMRDVLVYGMHLDSCLCH